MKRIKHAVGATAILATSFGCLLWTGSESAYAAPSHSGAAIVASHSYVQASPLLRTPAAAKAPRYNDVSVVKYHYTKHGYSAKTVTRGSDIRQSQLTVVKFGNSPIRIRINTAAHTHDRLVSSVATFTTADGDTMFRTALSLNRWIKVHRTVDGQHFRLISWTAKLYVRKA